MTKNSSKSDNKALIDELSISVFSDTDVPLSKNDIAVLNLQLNAAKIILSDAQMRQQEYPQQNLGDIIAELAETWKLNIQDLALALSERK